MSLLSLRASDIPRAPVRAQSSAVASNGAYGLDRIPAPTPVAPVGEVSRWTSGLRDRTLTVPPVLLSCSTLWSCVSLHWSPTLPFMKDSARKTGGSRKHEEPGPVWVDPVTISALTSGPFGWASSLGKPVPHRRGAPSRLIERRRALRLECGIRVRAFLGDEFVSGSIY